MPAEAGYADQHSRFVGRAAEMRDTAGLLNNPDCRLLTITGVGGIGKTRLAVELAKAQQYNFRHGVCFVSLQPVRSSKQIILAVMDALGTAPSGQETPENQCLQYLQEKHLLLLLDNFEHLLAGVDTLTRIIRHAPGVKLLVTSRESLSIPEEWLYPLAGLPIPRSHQTDAIEDGTAVEMFVDRAQQVRPGFSLSDNQASVVRICQLVEGLPLALEMAASWTKTLRCSEIAAEIQHNINFLSSNLRHVPERHRSMQAVFTQTWHHLTENEQTLFRRLAVFRGGFRREAAEAVAGASLPVLSSLLDKSLLRREPGGRYQVHELLRQFAAGKSGADEQQSLHEAHCRYYCEFLAQRKLGLTERTQVATSAEVEADLENIRTAWRYAVEHHLADTLCEATTAYFYFCQLQSRYLESAEASGQAVAVFEQTGDHEWLAWALVHQGWMLIRLGRYEDAISGLERSKALFEELQLIPVYGMGSHPLAPLAIANVVVGDYARATELGEQLKADAAARGDNHNLSFACYGLTSAYLNQGQLETALSHALEAVRLVDTLGNDWFGAYCHIELGNVHRAMGSYADAEQHYRESLRIRQAYRDPEGVAVTMYHLGKIMLLQHDYRSARQLFEQSLSIYENLNDRGGLATAHHGLSQAARLSGSTRTAVHHIREALDIACQISFLPLQLSLLIDAGLLMLHHKRQKRGAELLRLVQDHPARSRQQQDRVAAALDGLPLYESIRAPDFDTTLIVLRTELLEFIPAPRTDESLALIDPLTERELDVLRLLGQGLSNPAIAEQLVVAVGTVKAHTNHIFSKLGVSNRVEAVIRAQELSLLDDGH